MRFFKRKPPSVEWQRVVEEAKTFIRRLLASGPLSYGRVRIAAKTAGIRNDALNQAADYTGVVFITEPDPNRPGELSEMVMWELPNQRGGGT